MHLSARLVLSGGLWLAACQTQPSSGPVDVGAAPPAALPAPSTRARTVKDPSWVGTWTSASCADRTYVRQIVVEAEGTFLARDLVAPCPPGARCIWAGVVERRGAWRATSEGLVLQSDVSSDKGAPFPSTLAWDEVLRAPVEQAQGARCAYTRL